MSSPMFTPFIINTPSMIKSRSGGKKQQQQTRRAGDPVQPGQPQQNSEPLIDNRPRRPKACVGDGELLRTAPTTTAEQRPVFRLIRSSAGGSTSATPSTAVPTTAGVKRRLTSTTSPGAVVAAAAVAPRPTDTATPPKRILIRKAPQATISNHQQQQGVSVHPEPSSSNTYSGMSQYYHGDSGSMGHVVADGAGNESDSQHEEIIDVMGGLEDTLDVDRKPPIHIGSPRVRIHRQHRYEDELDEETRNDPQSAALANSYNDLAACLKRNHLSGTPTTDHLIEQMGAATVALREVRKQNDQFTKKTEIYSSKLKQMESLLMDRNLRLKKLLSDNLRMGARLRRMESEVGVDRVKELFGSEQLQ